MDTEEHVDRVAWAVRDLVRHLERQATEHVHALDALRAEVESLRTQNAHLRNQLTEAHNGLGGVDHLTQRVAAVEAENAHLRALQAAQEAKPKPVREVVRGLIDGYANMSEPGSDANKYAVDQGVRQATEYWHRKWMMHDVDGSDVGNATESEAIAWVLDGVLPAR